jgi:hypothetical protein
MEKHGFLVDSVGTWKNAEDVVGWTVKISKPVRNETKHNKTAILKGEKPIKRIRK